MDSVLYPARDAECFFNVLATEDYHFRRRGWIFNWSPRDLDARWVEGRIQRQTGNPCMQLLPSIRFPVVHHDRILKSFTQNQD